MLDTLLRLDGQLLVAIQGLHQPWLDPIVSFYTKLGDAGLLFIALSLAMLFHKSTRRAGVLALCAMILGLLVTNVTIKPLVERARPWLVWPITPLVTERTPTPSPRATPAPPLPPVSAGPGPCPRRGSGFLWWCWPC